MTWKVLLSIKSTKLAIYTSMFLFLDKDIHNILSMIVAQTQSRWTSGETSQRYRNRYHPCSRNRLY